MNYREKLEQIYQRYEPSKLKDIDTVLKTYRGHESAFMEALVEKYESEAAAAPVVVPLPIRVVSRVEVQPRRTTTKKKEKRKSLPHSPPQEEIIPKRLTKTATPIREHSPAPPPQRQPSPSSSSTERVHPIREEEATREPDLLVMELQKTLHAMKTVDIASLAERLSRTPMTPSPHYTEVLTHTLHFIEYFSLQADRFVHLAEALQRFQEGATPMVTGTYRNPTRESIHSSSPPSPPSSATEGVVDTAPIRPFSLPPGPTPVVEVEEEEDDDGDTDMESEDPPPDPPSRVVHLAPHPTTGQPVLTGPLRDHTVYRLQSGIYYEAVVLDDDSGGGGEVEIAPEVAGEPVLLRPRKGGKPLFTISGSRRRVIFRDLVFIFGPLSQFEETEVQRFTPDPTVPPTPLVTVSHGAVAVFEGCHFYRGGAGGVVASGAGTVVDLHHCYFSRCAQAAVYARQHCRVSLTHCAVKCCETGVYLSSYAAATLADTAIVRSASDGVVVQDGGEVSLRRCEVLEGEGNGLLVSPQASAVVEECRVEGNTLYGVQRYAGSKLRLLDCEMERNGLRSVSGEDAF